MVERGAQDGQMVLRWIAAGMGEARKQFRRVNGHLHLPALRAALDVPGWIQVGFQLYAQLTANGHRPIEVYPSRRIPATRRL